MSTGAGPFSFYQSLGGGQGGRGRRSSVAAYQRTVAQADKAAQARELLAAFERILSLHQAGFSDAHRPVAPLAPVDDAGIRARYEQHAVEGIAFFKRSARAEARGRAAAEAEREIEVEKSIAASEQMQLQTQLDDAWRLLCGNDPEVVLATLEEAFEDNEAPAAAVGLDGAEVSLVILVPGSEMVPERMPSTTQAGNLTLKKLPKGQRAAYYTLLVCGQLLVTLRETFAVAPGVQSARAVVLRSSGPDAYGRPQVDCLLAGRFSRKALDGVLWDTTESARIVNDISTDLVVNIKGQAKEMQPLDLSTQPDLLALIERVDLLDLVGPEA